MYVSEIVVVLLPLTKECPSRMYVLLWPSRLSTMPIRSVMSGDRLEWVGTVVVEQR